MTQEPAQFPQLSPEPMVGDSDLLRESLAARDARIGRRGTKRKEDTSLYTRAVQGASEFGEKLRTQFRKDVPAPIMKRKLSRAQVKQRILAMSPEERLVRTKEWGRPFIELAAQIVGEEN
tara:strand:- start:147 stop:506 length:360 start_codon:yes stop_codon:yes gene_type:complete